MTTNPLSATPLDAGASSTSDSNSAVPKQTLASQETFLQLLVAQIKNQDPLNPTDGVQFLAQLAQFSSLEQQLQMNSQLTDIKNELADLPTALTPQTGG